MCKFVVAFPGLAKHFRRKHARFGGSRCPGTSKSKAFRFGSELHKLRVFRVPCRLSGGQSAPVPRIWTMATARPEDYATRTNRLNMFRNWLLCTDLVNLFSNILSFMVFCALQDWRLSHAFSCQELGWDNVYRRASVLAFLVLSASLTVSHCAGPTTRGEFEVSEPGDLELQQFRGDLGTSDDLGQELSILGPSPSLPSRRLSDAVLQRLGLNKSVENYDVLCICSCR